MCLRTGAAQRNFSTAVRDNDARKATLHEMEIALNIATIIPFEFFVVHLGVPVAQHPALGRQQSRGGHPQHRGHSCGWLNAAGVKVALEVMGNNLSTAPDLVEMLERSFEGANLGICMDVGHAHILGDTAEAIETTSEYLVTTHIHDNRGGTATTISSLSRAASTGPPPSWRSRRSATMEC